MRDSDALDVLLTTPARHESVRHIANLPAREGEQANWPAWADPRLVEAYQNLGVEKPWTHQRAAADAVHAGHHTVVATSTGSGKSLAVWLPALSGILSAPAPTGQISALRRRPTALYLSPTKALAADQLAALDRLLAAGELRRDLRITTCDGDTPMSERDWVRSHADVVLTNPDFLHFSMLPGHERWVRLLRGLSYVVIDECHAYRGVLGAHVALVLRRLLRIARHLGADPVVIAASATTGEPGTTLARLIGVDPALVEEITNDGAPQGHRRVVLWEPPVVSPAWQDWGEEAAGVSGAPADAPRKSALTESADLLSDLVAARRRTLAFVRSRAGAEAVALTTAQALDQRGFLNQSQAGSLLATQARDAVDILAAGGSVPVAAYRGGYLPEERRALEDGLRDGRLLGLATTNALELGVDVSGLDAVLMSGWPGTRVSFWQQAGRAGRAGRDGVAVLVASANPLDTYLVHNPEAIFGEPVEATTFDPANPYVLAPHLCAAAAEIPLTLADLDLFGLADSSLPDELVRRGLLRKRPAGWFWNHARPESPSRLTDLRGSGQLRGVSVVERESGLVLGTVDGGRADSTVHPGAVYLHQGRTFVVEELHDDVAVVRREDVPHRTVAKTATQAHFVDVVATQQWGPVRWYYGHVEVTSQVQGYDVRRPPSMEVVGSAPLEMPLHTLPTTGVWWTVAAEVLTEELGIAPGDIPGSLHAAEHASIGILPLLATCDRWDIGGISTALHAETLTPTVLVHDGYPGGAGFAERGFHRAAAWMEATYRAVATCVCSTGCPRCVQSPKCGNGNSPLDKAGALKVLNLLRSRSS